MQILQKLPFHFTAAMLELQIIMSPLVLLREKWYIFYIKEDNLISLSEPFCIRDRA